MHPSIADGAQAEPVLANQLAVLRETLNKGRRASSLSAAKQHTLLKVIAELENDRAELLKKGGADGETAVALIKQRFAQNLKGLKDGAARGGRELENVFSFCEQAFRDSDEMLIFVTELTVNYFSARFIGHYGCDKYYLHNKELQFQERNEELVQRVNKIDWSI